MIQHKLEIKKPSFCLQSPRSHKSITSRRSSNFRGYQRSSFEQQMEIETQQQHQHQSQKLVGLHLKDPYKVDELMKKRQLYFPKKEPEKQHQRNPDIFKPYDLLKKTIPDINQEQQQFTPQTFEKQQQEQSKYIEYSGDPRKNFFEFNTYFYKNYQANNNGPCTTLPQILIKKVETFQNRLEQMIKEL